MKTLIVTACLTIAGSLAWLANIGQQQDPYADYWAQFYADGDCPSCPEPPCSTFPPPPGCDS